MDVEQFVDDVRRMGKLQKEYFRTRDKAILFQSKSAEAAVDRFLESYGQPELFSELPKR